MLLDGGLEDEQAGRGARVAGDLAAVDGLLLLAERGRGQVDERLHQAADTDIGLRGDAEDGQDLILQEAGGQAFADLLGGEFHGLEELLHQFVGTFRGLLHDFGTEFLGLVGIGGGDFEFLVLGVVELHRDHIHDAFQADARVHRELADGDLLAEGLGEGGAGVLPVGLVMVELVDGDDDRHLVLVGVAGEDLGTDLDTGGAVDHEDRTLDNLESGKGTAAEVIGTGRVNEIDLVVLELGVERSRIDGLLVGLFELGVVGNRVLLFDTAAAVNYFALVEHGLGERGLARAGRADKDHVADVLGGITFHLQMYCCYYFVGFSSGAHLSRA